MRNLLLISSSRLHGYPGYLEAFEKDVRDFLCSFDVKKVLFIPYASKNYNKYVERISPAFNKLDFEIEGIHKHEDPISAVKNAQAIFIGGGNSFLLLKTLYDNNLIDEIRNRVVLDGMPYMGVSAGTNVATKSINTSNDMPIVYPPTFNAMNLVPFNINPHYVETPKDTTHMGETRDCRILEFLENVTDVKWVLGLKEGGLLHVSNDKVTLKGVNGAKLFIRDNKPQEYEVGSDLSFLLLNE